MRKWALVLSILALLSACVSMPSGEQAEAPNTAATEVARLEESWTTAFNNRDTRFMEKVMAPEFVLVTSGGPHGAGFTHRADWMRVWLGQERLPYKAKIINLVVAGDTAVATLEASWRRQSYLTDTWTRRHGRWQLIARHSAAR